MKDEMLNNFRKIVYGDPENPNDMGLEKEVEYGAQHKEPFLRQYLEKINAVGLDKERIVTSNRDAGHVAAASGDRTVDFGGLCWPLDWALIKLSRPLDNTLLNLPPDHFLSGYDGMEVEHWSDFENLSVVTKRGRTTGWTNGNVNGIESGLRLTRRSGNNDYLAYQKEVSSWCVLPSGSNQFALTGDLGSFILDQRGRIVALLYAAHPAIGHTYCIPFSVVLKDIEVVTGGQVVYPSKAN